MDYRERNRRDRITLTYACGDVEFDPCLRRYGFYARTDDDTFNNIEHLCRAENIEFTTAYFNNFIAQVNGNVTDNRLLWSHVLPAKDVLAGERILINDGYDNSQLDLLKLSSNDYLVVSAGAGSGLKAMDMVSISPESFFSTGSTVDIYPVGKITVYTVEFLMPTAMNRAVDSLKMRGFARRTVADDLRGFYKGVVFSLREGRFTDEFDDILAEACSLGVSSWVVRTIADAYTSKYNDNEQ